MRFRTCGAFFINISFATIPVGSLGIDYLRTKEDALAETRRSLASTSTSDAPSPSFKKSFFCAVYAGYRLSWTKEDALPATLIQTHSAS